MKILTKSRQETQVYLFPAYETAPDTRAAIQLGTKNKDRFRTCATPNPNPVPNATPILTGALSISPCENSNSWVMVVIAVEIDIAQMLAKNSE